VGGIQAPVFASTATQVTFQVPVELAGQAQGSIIVTVGNQTSNAATFSMGTYAPGLFATNQGGSGQGAILISNSAIVAAPTGTFQGSRPANRGEFVTIYATGLGPVTNQPATGVKASVSPLSATTTVPFVTIGGIPATVSFSGLTPNFFGLYQIDVQVPQGLAPSSAVPVLVNIGGVPSNIVNLAVQ